MLKLYKYDQLGCPGDKTIYRHKNENGSLNGWESFGEAGAGGLGMSSWGLENNLNTKNYELRDFTERMGNEQIKSISSLITGNSK